MSSSNSFNVCPRCGKANSLNAKFCSSCGQKLTAPQEIIVCPKCHRANTSMASFCGACGAPLRVGAQTKICPKCHKEVDANENVCSCGYSFSGVKYATPTTTKKSKKNEKHNDKRENVAVQQKPASKKGGRLAAVISLIFVLLLAYLIFAPYQLATATVGVAETMTQTQLRPDFLANLDQGLINSESTGPIYGFELIFATVDMLMAEGEFADNLQYVISTFGIGGIIITVLCAIIAITAVLQILVCIVRIISGGRNKRKNVYYLIMAIITTLWAALVVVFTYVVTAESAEIMQTIAAIFVPANFSIGYIAYLIPVYFWLFFIISLCTKVRKVKEAV